MTDEKQIRKLEKLETQADEIIYKVNAFFPLQLFPDSISVDKNKITIIYRWFFWEKRIFAILLEDLKTIKVSTGPLFATIYFELQGYEDNPTPITYIPKKDAFKLHEIVMGLTKAQHAGIELEKVTNSRIRKIQKLGAVHENMTSAI